MQHCHKSIQRRIIVKKKQLKGENDSSKIRQEKARPNIAKLNKVLFWIYLKEGLGQTVKFSNIGSQIDGGWYTVNQHKKV